MTKAAVSLESLAAKLDRLLAQSEAGERRFLGIASAASYADISPESVRRLLSSGKLRALRPVKGKLLVDRHELDALILGSDQRPRRSRGRGERKP